VRKVDNIRSTKVREMLPKNRVLVFGPAYLDRVLQVDRPLVDPSIGPPLDLSVDGRLTDGAGLTVLDPQGGSIIVDLPAEWPGPLGEVHLSRPLIDEVSGWRRVVRGVAWHDDLGGMGAGFAAAMGGELVSALGAEEDPRSRAIADRLAHAGIPHHPIRVDGHPADWTLLITSAGFGDKLPIGFRGCHAALESLAPWVDRTCSLRIVAALPNRLATVVLQAGGAEVRVFAPAVRNMLDREFPLSGFAERIDLMSCNRREWESLPDREAVAHAIPVVAITDGPSGSVVRFREPDGRHAAIQVPAFPRSHPPRDTNRAGEAYAASLMATLMGAGWIPGPVHPGLVRLAGERASAAAALVLDRVDFGFPGRDEIEGVLRSGMVGSSASDEASSGV
jgi:hypothetical protein